MPNVLPRLFTRLLVDVDFLVGCLGLGSRLELEGAGPACVCGIPECPGCPCPPSLSKLLAVLRGVWVEKAEMLLLLVGLLGGLPVMVGDRRDAKDGPSAQGTATGCGWCCLCRAISEQRVCEMLHARHTAHSVR